MLGRLSSYLLLMVFIFGLGDIFCRPTKSLPPLNSIIENSEICQPKDSINKISCAEDSQTDDESDGDDDSNDNEYIFNEHLITAIEEQTSFLMDERTVPPTPDLLRHLPPPERA
jgi:hypothetical protein